MPQRVGALALKQVNAGELKMVLGVVTGLIFELVEQASRLGWLTLEPINAGFLQLHLAAGIAGFLRFFKSLERFVEILAFQQSLAEIESGQSAFRFAKVVDGV